MKGRIQIMFVMVVHCELLIADPQPVAALYLSHKIALASWSTSGRWNPQQCPQVRSSDEACCSVDGVLKGSRSHRHVPNIQSRFLAKTNPGLSSTARDSNANTFGSPKSLPRPSFERMTVPTQSWSSKSAPSLWTCSQPQDSSLQSGCREGPCTP